MKKGKVNYAKVGLGIVAGGIGFYLLSGVALFAAATATAGVVGVKVASAKSPAISEIGKEQLARSIQKGVKSGKIEHRDMSGKESVHYKGVTGLKLRAMAWMFDKDGATLRQACAEESRRQNTTKNSTGSKIKNAVNQLRKDDSKVFVNPTKPNTNTNGWVNPQSNKTFIGDKSPNSQMNYGNPNQGYNKNQYANQGYSQNQYGNQGYPQNNQYGNQGYNQNQYGNQSYNQYGNQNQYGNPNQGYPQNNQYDNQGYNQNQYGNQVNNQPKVDPYGRPIVVNVPEQYNRYGYTENEMNSFRGDLAYRNSLHRDETPVISKTYSPSIAGFSIEEVPHSFGYGDRMNSGLTTSMITGLEHNARIKNHTEKRLHSVSDLDGFSDIIGNGINGDDIENTLAEKKEATKPIINDKKITEEEEYETSSNVFGDDISPELSSFDSMYK